MHADTVIALGVFAVTYALMLTEKVHKTVAVLAGGCAMVVLHVVSQEAAFESIDLGVIFLLTGMMIIVHFLAESGFFGYIAIRIAQIAKGKPLPLITLLCLVTAGLSALVDNVTTVLLIAPVTLLVAEQLEVSAIPYLMFEVLASNVGGTATLIGDPPNILIGSAADLSFMDFLVHLTPITAVCTVALVALALLAIRKSAHVSSDIRARVMEMNASRAINDPKMLKQSGVVLSLVLVGLLLHDVAHIEPATVALAGAALLLVITKADPEKVFHAVEWPTLFFFIGLFMVVSGLVATGILSTLANAMVNATGGNLLFTSMLVLWFSALTSAVLGNVPVVTTLIPVVAAIQTGLAADGLYSPDTIEAALWWPLALGACLGGNGTVFGGAANIIVVDIARNNRNTISFRQFVFYSIPVTLATLLLASVYVVLRYAP